MINYSHKAPPPKINSMTSHKIKLKGKPSDLSRVLFCNKALKYFVKGYNASKKKGGGDWKNAIFVSTDMKMLVATRVIKVLRGEEASSWFFFHHNYYRLAVLPLELLQDQKKYFQNWVKQHAYLGLQSLLDIVTTMINRPSWALGKGIMSAGSTTALQR